MNIQHEITDNYAVFSEDCKGSVWKSKKCNGASNLLHKLAIYNDFETPAPRLTLILVRCMSLLIPTFLFV